MPEKVTVGCQVQKNINIYTENNLPENTGQEKDREVTEVQTFLFQKLFTGSLATSRNSPDFELGAGREVGRELLDERQQHGLGERTRVLAEHLLRVDGLAHVQDQVQVCGRQCL